MALFNFSGPSVSTTTSTFTFSGTLTGGPVSGFWFFTYSGGNMGPHSFNGSTIILDSVTSGFLSVSFSAPVTGITATGMNTTFSGGSIWNFSLSAPSLIGFSLSGVNCFATGTQIATPTGERAVEDLEIGDLVRTEDGRDVPVRWVGHQTMDKRFASPWMQPVRIRKGALGDGVPNADLTVTADHGMIVDGFLINASALVNGDSIDWVPIAELADHVTYYHVETDAHEPLLANGAPAESFLDAVGRSDFDNHQDYLDRFDIERIIPEMPLPRISSQRLLPAQIRERLKIGKTAEALPLAS